MKKFKIEVSGVDLRYVTSTYEVVAVSRANAEGLLRSALTKDPSPENDKARNSYRCLQDNTDSCEPITYEDIESLKNGEIQIFTVLSCREMEAENEKRKRELKAEIESAERRIAKMKNEFKELS